MRYKKTAGMVVAVCLSCIVGYVLWSMVSFQIKLRAHRDAISSALGNPEMCRKIGDLLAQLSHTATSNVRQTIDETQIPIDLRRIGPLIEAYYDDHEASIVMGGGWYRYGYELVLDEQMSTTTTSVWNLYVRVGDDDASLRNIKYSATTDAPLPH